MKKILFATENEAKVKRFKEKLLQKNIEIITINDLDKKVEIEENGKDGVENALIKARAYKDIVDIPVIAMDSNLYIENIPEDKQPGVYVRRINGKRLNDEEMIDYYKNLAHTYGNGKLTAKWIYGCAIINNQQEATYTWSMEDFYIVDKPSKILNPGYPLNSISISKITNKYISETQDNKEKKDIDKDVIEFIHKNIK